MMRRHGQSAAGRAWFNREIQYTQEHVLRMTAPTYITIQLRRPSRDGEDPGVIDEAWFVVEGWRCAVHRPLRRSATWRRQQAQAWTERDSAGVCRAIAAFEVDASGKQGIQSAAALSESWSDMKRWGGDLGTGRGMIAHG